MKINDINVFKFLMIIVGIFSVVFILAFLLNVYAPDESYELGYYGTVTSEDNIFEIPLVLVEDFKKANADADDYFTCVIVMDACKTNQCNLDILSGCLTKDDAEKYLENIS